MSLVSSLYNRDDRQRLCFSQIPSPKEGYPSFADKKYPPFADKKPQVLASCNELIYLSYGGVGKDILWNPSTNEYKFLPPALELPPCKDHPDGDSDYYCVDSYGTTCDCISVHDSCGLGFDVETQDYKLVKFVNIFCGDELFCGEEQPQQQVVVYSMKNNSWNVIPDVESDVSISERFGIFVGGFAYWKAKGGIVSFDFVNERVATLPYPNIPSWNDEWICNLIEYNGSLCYAVYPDMGNTKDFRFWAMDMEGGWRRKTELNVCLVGASHPLGFFRNGSSLMLQGMDGALMKFDYIARKLDVIAEIYHFPLCMALYPHVHNSVQLNGEFEVSEED